MARDPFGRWTRNTYYPHKDHGTVIKDTPTTELAGKFTIFFLVLFLSSIVCVYFKIIQSIAILTGLFSFLGFFVSYSMWNKRYWKRTGFPG